MTSRPNFVSNFCIFLVTIAIYRIYYSLLLPCSYIERVVLSIILKKLCPHQCHGWECSVCLGGLQSTRVCHNHMHIYIYIYIRDKYCRQFDLIYIYILYTLL